MWYSKPNLFWWIFSLDTPSISTFLSFSSWLHLTVWFIAIDQWSTRTRNLWLGRRVGLGLVPLMWVTRRGRGQ